MPIYEYRCEGCGNRFEKLVRGEARAVECPGCGGEQLERQYSTFAAQVSGGGGDVCAPAPSGGCGAGMCGSPGFCSRN